jgi:hypothetical protein
MYGAQFTFVALKFISDTKWLSLITETYLEGLDAHNGSRLQCWIRSFWVTVFTCHLDSTLVLAELEERCVRLILKHRPNLLKNF